MTNNFSRLKVISLGSGAARRHVLSASDNVTLCAHVTVTLNNSCNLHSDMRRLYVCAHISYFVYSKHALFHI